MHFKTRRTGKSKRDRNLIKNHFNKRAVLASVLKTIFISEKPKEICDRLKSILQEKQAGKNSDVVNREMGAIIDKLLEYNCMTPTHHKKLLKILMLYRKCKKTRVFSLIKCLTLHKNMLLIDPF